MAPLDPGRHWLAAGITGLARQREWDAVATAEGPGEPDDEAQLVALEDGRVLVERGPATLDSAVLTTALEGQLERPYRALAVRRPEHWAIGAVGIDVARLDPDPPADELVLTWDGEVATVHADGVPAGLVTAAGLEALATSRLGGPYAAHAVRLVDDLWEVSVLPL